MGTPENLFIGTTTSTTTTSSTWYWEAWELAQKCMLEALKKAVLKCQVDPDCEPPNWIGRVICSCCTDKFKDYNFSTSDEYVDSETKARISANLEGVDFKDLTC